MQPLVVTECVENGARAERLQTMQLRPDDQVFKPHQNKRETTLAMTLTPTLFDIPTNEAEIAQ